MATDGLVMQGARSLAALVLTENILSNLLVIKEHEECERLEGFCEELYDVWLGTCGLRPIAGGDQTKVMALLIQAQLEEITEKD